MVDSVYDIHKKQKSLPYPEGHLFKLCCFHQQQWPSCFNALLFELKFLELAIMFWAKIILYLGYNSRQT